MLQLSRILGQALLLQYSGYPEPALSQWLVRRPRTKPPGAALLFNGQERGHCRSSQDKCCQIYDVSGYADH